MGKSAVSSLSEAVVDLAEETLIRVLYVDDETDLLKCARQILEMQGNFKVETASSVDEAMEELREKKFDVVVSDYVMPEKSGLDFLKELREGGNNIPFILFTGKGREEVAIKALNLGADRYFNKNGNPESVYGELAYGIRQAVDRRRADKEIWNREERLRATLASSPDAMIITDFHGIITECNEQLLKLTGISSRKEVIGKRSFDLIAEDDRHEAMNKFKELFEQGIVKNIEFHILTTDGHKIPAKFSASILKNAKGNPIGAVGVVRDITERKKAEEALRRSEKYLDEILNSVLTGVVIIDEKTHEIVDVNMNALDMINAPEENIVGKLCYQFICPAEKGKCPISDLGQIIDRSEHVLFGANGEKIPVLKTVTSTEWGGKKYLIESFVDISERKKAEEKLDTIMKELVTINEKLGAVSRLTRHDARNKLAVILNNAYLAKQGLADKHSALEYLGEIESAVDQMEQLFDFARTYEMVGVEELSNQDVAKSVNEAAFMFPKLAGMKLVNECHGLTVLADSLLRQLFYNFIDNTLRHGEKASKIRVHYKEVGKDNLKLVYEDDGIGIPEDEKTLIFNEGYGKNTGHGLYLIKKMCAEYGWTIQETGKPGKGAQFTMTIPKMHKNGKITYKLQ